MRHVSRHQNHHSKINNEISFGVYRRKLIPAFARPPGIGQFLNISVGLFNLRLLRVDRIRALSFQKEAQEDN